MPKTYIRQSNCPFQEGDEVRCDHSGMESVVDYVEDEHVFCTSREGRSFYRTWSHELGIMGKSGGGLTRTHRPEPKPDGGEPNESALSSPPAGQVDGDSRATL